MRLGESFAQALSNLRDMKLRTALTALGVAVGIAALVAMVGFGQGVQSNVTESFEKLDLFSSITVMPRGLLSGLRPGRAEGRRAPIPEGAEGPVLDDEAVGTLARLPGVESAWPEVRFPAVVAFRGNEEFRLVQMMPPAGPSSKPIRLAAGRPFRDPDEPSVIVSRALLGSFGVRDAASVIGAKVRVSSIALDFGALEQGGLGALLGQGRLPLKRESYDFSIVGVTDSGAIGGPLPIGSDVFLPSGWAGKIARLPFSSVWDLFRTRDGRPGYSAVDLRLTSPAAVDPVERRVRDLGFSTFALADQFREVKTSFVYLNMILAAIGMIAIFVAALGIVNTMVMSILERYTEIGIMKAVGASHGDIKRIFFFESGTIGFAGGLGGLVLGVLVSGLINRIVNTILARQGIPPIEYFRYPLWLCLGAMAFAVGVSLVSGVYPAWRASRVDPVVALRHE